MARHSIPFFLMFCSAAALAAGSGVLVDSAAPGHAAGSCTRFYGTVNTASGDPTLGSTVYPDGGLDVSAKGGLGFWCRGDGGAYQVMIHQAGNIDHNDYLADFTPPVGWSYVEIPWSSFAHPGWGAPYDFDYHKLGAVTWMALTNGGFDFSVEAVDFVGPKATPTRALPLGMDALEILDLAPVPDPNPKTIAIRLASPADRVELKLYGVSGACLKELQLSGLPAGWTQIPLPADWMQVPDGLSLLRATAGRGAHYQVRSKVAKFFVLR